MLLIFSVRALASSPGYVPSIYYYLYFLVFIVLVAPIIWMYVKIFWKYIKNYIKWKIKIYNTEPDLRDIVKVSRYLKNPERIEYYSKNNNLTISEIEREIGKGITKGYTYRGILYIENKNF